MDGGLMDARAARWMDVWIHEWLGNFPHSAEPNFLAIAVLLVNYPQSLPLLVTLRPETAEILNICS